MLRKKLLERALKRYLSGATHLCLSPHDHHTFKYEIQHNLSHANKLSAFFEKYPHLKRIKEKIPQKYLGLKRKTPPPHLYLIDTEVAKDAAQKILPSLLHTSGTNSERVICETNAGLGLISKELIDNGVSSVRMYETCPYFRESLRDFCVEYAGRVELFKKDLFNLQYLSYIDKVQPGDRVKSMLRGVPVRSWSDPPVMSIIGATSNMTFIKYFLRTICYQNDLAVYGRIELYVFLKPKDYFTLTANPNMSLHAYKGLSVLFQMFGECQLLEKYPRVSFLPWETKKSYRIKRKLSEIDTDVVYLVKIKFKPKLPVKNEHLLSLYTFITQIYRLGGQFLIPTLEKHVPNCGELILTQTVDPMIENVGIYTKFGELHPDQILSIFRLVAENTHGEEDPFLSLSESQIIKEETIDSDLADCDVEVDADKDYVEEFEEKF